MKEHPIIVFATSLFTAFIGFICAQKLTSFYKNKKKTESEKSKQVYFECKRIDPSSRYSFKRFWEKEKSMIGLFLLGVLSFSWMNNNYGGWLKTSLIGIPTVTFTGTEMPIKKVPNWSKLTAAERSYSYSNIPSSKIMDILPYDVASMKRGSNYSNASASDVNTYVTYSVPYMGNYALDGSEHSGSHPGIDIKVPYETPVYSIANGIVYKSDFQTGGFGNFVTVEHPNVPDPENPGQKVTLYSTYAHLNSREVKEGAIVNKGELIAYSGSSGSSTAPHLHFQVDREGSPFIPYWPFSWNDVQAAGYGSYFDGVRYGVGKNKAYQYTVNGIEFVNQNLNYNLVASTQTATPEKSEIEVEEDDSIPNKLLIDEIKEEEEERVRGLNPKVIIPTPPKSLEENDVEEEPEEKEQPEEPENDPYTTISEVPRPSLEDAVPQRPIIEKPKVTIKKNDTRIYFNYNETGFVEGEEQKVSLNIEDEILVATSEINISSTLRDLAEVKPSVISSQDVKNGVVDVYVTPQSNSDFRIIASGDFGEVKSDLLRSQVFSDISPDNKAYTAIKSLKDKGVINGYSDGTFKPEQTLNRAEALKILIEANHIGDSTNTDSFPDVAPGAWYEPYVFSGISYGIVDGYKDGKFYPRKEVSRAEFIKMALLSGDYTIPSKVDTKPYPDVEVDAWFAPHMLVVRNQNILPTRIGGYIDPKQPITRAEAADVIYKLERGRI